MRRVALLAIVLCSALSSRAEILLKGIAAADGTAKFSLYSSEDQTSKWVLVGQSFGGYAVTEFRPDREILVLKKGNEVLELRMAPARIATANPVPMTLPSAEAEGRAAALAAAREKTSSAQVQIKLLQEELERLVAENLLKKPIRDLPTTRELPPPKTSLP